MSYSPDRPPGGSPYGAAAYGPPPWSAWTAWDPGPVVREWMAFRPLRIALVVLAFIWWWPIGLATVFVMMWSRRMGCWSYGPRAYRQDSQAMDGRSEGPGPRGCGPWGGWGRKADRTQASSGNRAFDEYRAETLRRLEEEQRDFVGFLDRLRYAKDKAEFDQFLAERRQRNDMPPPNAAPEQPESPNPA